MRSLYETQRFRSLTYRDMPFVLMPRLWETISSHSFNPGKSQRRAHRDDIFVDYASPEALEEIFWKTFLGDAYICSNHLVPHRVNRHLQDEFQAYVGRLTHSRTTALSYLSKNNNNILRISFLSRMFPKAKIIIPFRDPYQQAFSLCQQHKHFKALQETDGFIRFYMDSIGHYEFGLGHKPFVFAIDDPVELDALSLDTLDYWLGLWINTYSHLLENVGETGCFLSYETFCSNAQSIINSIVGEQCELPERFSTKIKPQKSRAQDNGNLNIALLSRADELFSRLRNEESVCQFWAASKET